MSEKQNIEQMVGFFDRLKNIFIGKARDMNDSKLLHKISLVAFFAWIGLGSDGISSSCYGPEEAFRNLSGHHYLAIFVALGTVFTIFIVSSSYSQIIELFPHGGGGYLVASKLLSPTVGMIAGCSLLIDYVLTITLSISSGADAIFSFIPVGYHSYKLTTALIVLILLIVMNLRGVKESVLSLTPIFAIFILTHVFAIFYIIITHGANLAVVAHDTSADLHSSFSEVGVFGTIFLILRAYSMGAGTFTGIEAVSNGLPVLREPRVKTAHKTMRLMAISLSFLVLGLMFSYAIFDLHFEGDKTLNAILFEKMTASWYGQMGTIFVFVTLISEATLLFVAAQTGFLDGPRIMANMAIDMWFPKRFASLSDRLVTKNGVLLMGVASIILLIVSKGSVKLLVVLYSINVFITFCLSQLGMVKHWWQVRKTDRKWKRKLAINGIGLILTSFILISVVIIKFTEGGWATLLITGMLAFFAIRIRMHYYSITKKLHWLQGTISSHLNEKICQFKLSNIDPEHFKHPNCDGKTAIILISGYNATGLHTFFNVLDKFSGVYENFIFLEVGNINAGNFKGFDHLVKVKMHVDDEVNKYIDIANELGYYARGYWNVGTEVVSELERIVPRIIKRFPNATVFGGQLVFSEAYYLSKVLHNHSIFTIQRKLYKRGITTVILPIHID